MSKTSNRFSVEVRARAVRMVLEHKVERPSRLAALAEDEDDEPQRALFVLSRLVDLATQPEDVTPLDVDATSKASRPTSSRLMLRTCTMPVWLGQEVQALLSQVT